MTSDRMPPYAVYAGIDTDGDIIYVGRAYYNGDWLPAKLIPNKGKAFVSWDGKQYSVKKFEILCGKNFTWVASLNGNLPEYAVPSGPMANGKLIYIGRGHWYGSLTPGKIIPPDKFLYIPYKRRELKICEFDALVRLPTSNWIPSFGGAELPRNAVLASEDSNGNPIYVGRANHLGVLMPAKVSPIKKCAYVGYHGELFVQYHFEVLCGTDYVWIKAADGKVISNAVECGEATSGETLFVGRANHCGRYILGKVRPLHHCLYITYGNQELPFQNYEMLIQVRN